MSLLWSKALEQLEKELTEQQFLTWIRPLKAREEAAFLYLIAPSGFIYDWVNRSLLKQIENALFKVSNNPSLKVKLELGGYGSIEEVMPQASNSATEMHSDKSSNSATTNQAESESIPSKSLSCIKHALNPHYTFDTFVTGKANQLAAAAARQVSENPGGDYNPFFIYGSSGLGKTHIIHAIGNEILRKNPKARVVYLHSERFVADMVNALRHNKIDEFKRFYRSLDALLIDDIQFFANKEQTQEEFFHTFNTLLEGNKQIILTSDRFPKEVDGLEDRLKSRFGWGLTLQVEPPEFEMRVAILMRKAAEYNFMLPDDVAFFIANRLRGNVRDLEGALKRVGAVAKFTQQAISVDVAKEALKDQLALQQKMITLPNIQKTVADFFKIRVSDLLSKKRTRNLVRPRQMAMAISKELTTHSLPEIGDAFGGRDHTTVLHAVRKIKELKETDHQIEEDFLSLIKIMTS